jgi:hypothetical protein
VSRPLCCESGSAIKGIWFVARLFASRGAQGMERGDELASVGTGLAHRQARPPHADRHAPIFSNLSRIVFAQARARAVPASPTRRSACISRQG